MSPSSSSSPSSFSLRAPAYSSWLSSRGIVPHPSLDVLHTDALGYHVVAREAVEKGALLLEVPLSACLLLRSEGDEHASYLTAAGLPGLYAAAVLLLARAPAALGPHHAVLASIRDLPTVLRWGERERHLLRGTSQEATVGTLPVRERFRGVVAPLLRARPDLFPAALADDEDGFEHACMLLLSRGFNVEGTGNAATSTLTRTTAAAAAAPAERGEGEGEGEGEGGAASSSSSTTPLALLSGPHFVPVADFMNHDPARACTQLARMGDAFRLYALRPLAKNEQVYSTYGALSDGQLLHTYGFVMPAVPADDEDAEAVAEARAEGETDGICLGFTDNAYNAVHVPSSLVESTVRLLLKAQGALSGKKEERDFDSVAKFLRERGVLPEGGFTLQRRPGGGASATSSPQPPDGTFTTVATEMIPPELFTAVQVLSQGEEVVRGYKAACGADGVALLPVERAAPPAGGRAASASASASAAAEGEEDGVDETLIDTWNFIIAVLGKRLRSGYPTSLLDDYAWWAAVCGEKGGKAEALFVESAAAAVGTKRKGRGGAGAEEEEEEAGTKRRKGDAHGHAAAGGSSSAAAAAPPSPLAHVELGRADPLYRQSRLVAMGEKEVLASLMGDISEDLAKAEETAEGEMVSGEEGEEGDEDEEDDDDSD
jgi:hypothetical protein